MPTLSFMTKPNGLFAVITMPEELDLSNGPEVTRLAALAMEDSLNLVLDLHQLAFMDSTGLQSMLRVYHRYKQRGGAIAFVAPHPRVSTVLRITGLENRLPIFDTLEAALHAWPTPQTGDGPDD